MEFTSFNPSHQVIHSQQAAIAHLKASASCCASGQRPSAGSPGASAAERWQGQRELTIWSEHIRPSHVPLNPPKYLLEEGTVQ